MNFKSFKQLWVIILLITLPNLVMGKEKLEVSDYTFYTAINMREIFSNNDYQKGQGIKGYTNNSGSVTVKVYSDIISENNVFQNQLLYEYRSDASLNTTTYTGTSASYSSGVPYNFPWKSDDLTTSTLYVKQDYVKKVWKGDGGFVDLTGSIIPVKIEVTLNNAEFTGANIRGLENSLRLMEESN